MIFNAVTGNFSILSTCTSTGEQLYAPCGPTRSTVGSLGTAKAFTGL